MSSRPNYMPKLPAKEVTALMKECVATADRLAEKARLAPDSEPLPSGTDFSDEEYKATIEQLKAKSALPKHASESVGCAFAAKYLLRLTTILRSLSHDTQPKAIYLYIRIISSLGNPTDRRPSNPYLKNFFMSEEHAKDLASLVASAIINIGQFTAKPGNLPTVCWQLYAIVVLGDSAWGDDGRACIDVSLRQALVEKLKPLMPPAEEDVGASGTKDPIRRLVGSLEVAGMDGIGPNYLNAIRHGWLTTLSSGIEGDADCVVCGEEEVDLNCSRCKSAWYCSPECQSRAWKEEHKLRCFDATFSMSRTLDQKAKQPTGSDGMSW
ncbi:hypothetical protein PENSPDRAFT_737688 [Peniophora sp. CONT]|nr:hypothetical protein PENSPDRAFT_737688 [Peniophora sp. CONT]